MLTNPFHNITFFTSFGFLLTSVVAWYHNLYSHGLLDFCLFLTSIGYWVYPLKDWRRVLDIFVVAIVSSFHFADTPCTEEMTTLIILIIGLYSYNKLIGGDQLYKALRHSTVHILAVVYFIKIYESLTLEEF